MQADSDTQNLLAERRAQQSQGMPEAEHHRLLQQFYSQPSVKAYQVAEKELRDLIVAIDEIISEAAGIPFAANAKGYLANVGADLNRAPALDFVTTALSLEPSIGGCQP
jgi:hypothetical protein